MREISSAIRVPDVLVCSFSPAFPSAKFVYNKTTVTISMTVIKIWRMALSLPYGCKLPRVVLAVLPWVSMRAFVPVLLWAMMVLNMRATTISIMTVPFFNIINSNSQLVRKARRIKVFFSSRL
jgi:hypothetical protein